MEIQSNNNPGFPLFLSPTLFSYSVQLKKHSEKTRAKIFTYFNFMLFKPFELSIKTFFIYPA